MIIGIPKEIKNNENRVGMTPAGVKELVQHGHQVYVQHTAGQGSDSPMRSIPQSALKSCPLSRRYMPSPK